MNSIDETHDPKRTSWVDSANGHIDFPVQNLPLGIFAPRGEAPRPGVAIGDRILDLQAIAARLPFAFAGSALNAFFAQPAALRASVRTALSALLSAATHRSALLPHLHDVADCTLRLPASIGDYTDFYVGIHHALNVGKQFRPDQPLLPNYKYVPIGYHGRASSVRPSGENVRRPRGQRKAADEDVPSFGPARRLDYELELGVWVGPGNSLGDPIPIGRAFEHVAGFCLLNDWSARDLQAWEYQPLGPFLAKSFHSTVSPWVITAEALAPYRRAQAPRASEDPRPLDYLWNDADQAHGALGIDLNVSLSTARMREEGVPPKEICRSAARHMYWTVAQIVTHHASNGCNLQPGDLLGTGTLSAPEASGYGSLLETTMGGKEPIVLPSGEKRTFLEDGDEITLRATAVADGFVSFGFGPCTGRIVAAPA